jgi:hypothetical protein
MPDKKAYCQKAIYRKGAWPSIDRRILSTAVRQLSGRPILAAIPYEDAQGRRIDFRAGTRKTLCTRMHRKGLPLGESYEGDASHRR